MKPKPATLAIQAISDPRSARSACAVGDESRRRSGSAVSRAGSSPVPMSRTAAIRQATTRSSGGRDERQQQDQRPGPGERPHLLGPAERREPAEPARAGGVGDHAQDEEHGHGGAAELERHAPRRRQLAGHGPDAGEDRGDRHRGQRQVRRAADGQLPGHEPEPLGQPQESDAAADRGQGRERIPSPARPSRPGPARPGPCPPPPAAPAPAARSPKAAAAMASVPPTRQAL